MAGIGDIPGLPPVTFDGAPDLASLPWPWDQPAVAPIPAAVAADPALPSPAVTPVVAADPASAGPGAPMPAAAAAEPAAPLQPGIGIPISALDGVVPPAPASPLPPPADVAPPPVVAPPAVGEPLLPAAGVPAPPADALPPVPPPAGEPALLPVPAPSPVALPPEVEPITGRLESTGAPSEPFQAGLAGAPLTPEQRYAKVAIEYQTDPGKLLDRLEQPGGLDADTQRYLDEFAARDPAGAAVLRQRLADVGMTKIAAERARIAKEDFDRQAANLAVRNKALAEAATKSAQIDADAEAMAQTKIGYHPSTLQRISGVLAAVVGGLYQGRTGSATNPGLVALNQVIDRDLEEQKLNLANKRDVLQQRRSALGELMARSNDQYQSDEVMRLAALKYADEQLAQQQLNFAPDGTRGMNLAAMRAGLNAQIAANKDARDGQLLERSLKVAKEAREQQTTESTIWKNKQDVALGWAKEAREGAKAKADNTVLTAEQIHQQFPDVPVSAIPAAGATVADMTKRQELYNKGQEANAKGRENAVNEAATVVRNPITKEPIIDTKTGQPARLRAEDATKLTDEIGKQQMFMDRMADIKRTLEQDPSALDRKAWAALQSKYERAKTDFIGTVGAKPSSREMQAVEEMFGTNFEGYTSRIKDKGTAIARIDALMDGTQSDALTVANLKLGYDGKPILRDPRQFAAHTEAPEETAKREAITRLLEKPNVSYDTALKQALQYRGPGTNSPPLSDADGAAVARAARAEAEQYKDISPQQRRDLVKLQIDAVTDPRALEELKTIAARAHSKVVRDIATNAASEAQYKIKDPDYPALIIADPSSITGGQ